MRSGRFCALRVAGAVLAVSLLAACVPLAPTGLQAEARNQTIVLRWVSGTETDLARYDIYRDGALLADVPATETRFVDSTVSNGVPHEYWIRAVNSADEVSPESNRATATATWTPPDGDPEVLERIVLSPDGLGFVKQGSGEPFFSFGFNYGGSNLGAGIVEDTWALDWAAYQGDLREMVSYGANTARISIQLSRFMTGPTTMNEEALDTLEAAIVEAEAAGLYVMLVGLNAFVGAEDPAWYLALDEQARWDAQAVFWGAVAARLVDRPGIFAYDLMNEPYINNSGSTDWTPGNFGGYSFTQALSLDTGTRDPQQVARDWITKMRDAIRAEDADHLITLGQMPFVGGALAPSAIGHLLDFMSPHLYPDAGKVPQEEAKLDAFQQGKPVVIGETFPLSCGEGELEWFLTGNRAEYAGVYSHYFGKTLEDMTPPPDLLTALHAAYLRHWDRLSFDLKAGAAKSVPLYRYESAALGSHAYFTTRNDASVAIYGFAYKGAEGHVQSLRPDAAAVPLCVHWNPTAQHHSISTGCGTPAEGASMSHFLGWAWTAAGTGRVPLRRYRAANGAPYYTKADFGGNAGALGFTYEAIEAYILP